MLSCYVFFDVISNCGTNSREAGDLKRYDAHVRHCNTLNIDAVPADDQVPQGAGPGASKILSWRVQNVVVIG